MTISTISIYFLDAWVGQWFPQHFATHLASRKLRDTALSRKSCDFDLAFFDEGLTTVVQLGVPHVFDCICTSNH